MNVVSRYLEKYKKISQRKKASLWFVFCSFFQKGVAFITVPIFTRMLSTEDYGVSSLFNTWSTLLVIFATLNLSGGVYTRGLLEFEEKKFTSSIQALSTFCTLIVAIIIFSIQGPLMKMSGLSIESLVVMILYFFVVAGINLWTVKQRFNYKYKGLVAVTICNTLATTAAGLLAVLFSTQSRGEAKAIWSTVGAIVIAIPFYIYNFRKGKTLFDKKIWKYALAFNLPLLPHYLSNLILHQSDRIMIGWYSGAASVAFYSLAYSVSSIVKVFTDSINQTLTPWRYQKMETKEYGRINKISISILICVSVLILAVCMLAPEIISIFGGASYLQAASIIPPIMLCVYFIYLYNMFSNIEFYFKKTKFMMVASAISAILNIALNYVFINKYGYAACAYTSLFCYIVYTACHFICMKKICKKEIGGKKIFDEKSILVITLATCALSMSTMVLYGFRLVRYIIILILLVVVIIKRKYLLQAFRVKK